MSFYILLILSPFLWAQNFSAEIVGSWKAIGYFYEGQFVQPEDPQLTLTFDFYADGTHRLYWKMKTDKFFCERKGLWRVEGDQLFMEVTWVNPESGSSCFQDPDMQMGKKTQSRIEVKNNQLLLEIPFSDSVIIYVYDFIPVPTPEVPDQISVNTK